MGWEEEKENHYLRSENTLVVCGDKKIVVANSCLSLQTNNNNKNNNNRIKDIRHREQKKEQRVLVSSFRFDSVNLFAKKIAWTQIKVPKFIQNHTQRKQISNRMQFKVCSVTNESVIIFCDKNPKKRAKEESRKK